MAVRTEKRGLGLQRRIMIYAAVGLGLLFVAWGVIGRKSIDQVSDLLLEERLATAQSVAASFADDLRHIRYDLQEDMEVFGVTGSDREASRTAEESFDHLVNVDEFVFLEMVGLVLVREDGATVARAPASLTAADVERIAPDGTWPLGPYTPLVIDAGEVAIIVKVPIQNRVDNAPATAFAIVGILSSPDPLVGFLPMDRQDEAVAGSPEYHLEIIDHDGLSVLGIGPEHYDSVGKITPHWDGIREIVQTGRQEIIREDRHGGVVALAVVPITGSRLYLLAMRHDDVAISAPKRMQDMLVLIGVAGFVGALVVVAVSTRRVVRPTSELTAVARRMAMGDLDSPVRVSAQDEIAQLAESIETMRAQLALAREQALRSNQELEQRVAERTDQLRRALRQVISAQEEERKRVARDLHDGLAQEMVILTRRLDSAREHLDPDGADQAELKELSDMSRANLASIREISRALRPSVLDDLGLIPALSWVVSEFKRRSNVEVEQHLPEASFSVADEPTLILFRAAQEAFANIDRHSGATRASISLTRANGLIELQICDNGCGFDVPSSVQELARRGHLGIIGMLERVELVGGELKIASTRNGPHGQFNTRVTATIPLDPI